MDETEEYLGYPISRLKKLKNLFIHGIPNIPGLSYEELRKIKDLDPKQITCKTN